MGKLTVERFFLQQVPQMSRSGRLAMAKRYERSDGQRDRTAALSPRKPGDRGQPGADNCLFVNGVL
jgi:hypothetical protein